MIFSVVKIIDKTNRHDTIYSEISDELSDFKNDIVQLRKRIQRTSESNFSRETTGNRRDRQQQHTDERISKKPRFLSR